VELQKLFFFNEACVMYCLINEQEGFIKSV